MWPNLSDEMDLLRQCALAARHQKARRAELIVTAPVGYVKSPLPEELSLDQYLLIDMDTAFAHCTKGASIWGMGQQ